MPLPLSGIIGGLLSAGTSIFTNKQNIQQQKATNAAQNQRNLELYNMQRADALSDWERQNQYNSPSQQMQRFKEAGLNPNLIYGQMTNAPAIRSTEAKAPDFVAPQIKGNPIADGIQSYQNIRQMDLTNKSIQNQILESQERQKKLNSETNYQDLVNQNLVDNSPNLKEVLHQKVLMNDATLRQMAQNLENNERLNPLQRDKISQEIMTLSKNRYWQNLSEPLKQEVLKAQQKLIKAQEDKTIDEADLIKLEYNRLVNFGLNRNFLGDLLKIIASGLIK
jgi:hypothetical protein